MNSDWAFVGDGRGGVAGVTGEQSVVQESIG